MGLIAEQIVEDWLYHQGFFTIRGAKAGQNEADLLAIRPLKNLIEAIHIEVQASHRPIGYISSLPKEYAKKNKISQRTAKKRDQSLLAKSVKQWVENKFNSSSIIELRQELCDTNWKKILVINVVRHQEEIPMIIDAGISVKYLPEILTELQKIKKNRGQNKQSKFASSNSELIELLDSLRPKNTEGYNA
jgi:hypothetical protein